MNQITASTRNPVLNAPEDITDELLQNIIANNLDSLTINYEFTCRDFRKCHRMKGRSFLRLHKKADIYLKERLRRNPFLRAN